MHILAAVAIADLKERLHQPRFFQVVCAFVLGATLLVPGQRAQYATLSSAAHVASPTSSFVGTAVALMLSVALVLFGPFLAQGTLQRDRNSSLGELLSSTSLSAQQYLLGKFISNLVLLGCLALIVQGTAILTFPFRGIDMLRLQDFIVPVLSISLVTATTMAALTLVWESWQFSQRPVSMLLYIILALLALVPGVALSGWLDLTGLGAFKQQLDTALPGADSFAFGFVPRSPVQQLVVVPGIATSFVFILQRGLWLIVALALVLMTAHRWRFQARRSHQASPATAPTTTESAGIPAVPVLAPPPAISRPTLGLMVAAELGLSLPRHPWLWAGIGGVWLAALVAPFESVRYIVTPLALLLIIPLVAPLACREEVHGATALMRSMPRAARSYVRWKSLTGALLILLCVAGPLLRSGWEAPSTALGLLCGCLFSLGCLILAGRLRGSAQLGTVSLGLLWYVSSWNQVPAWLDYAGIWIDPAQSLFSIGYAGLGLGCLALAAVWQRAR